MYLSLVALLCSWAVASAQEAKGTAHLLRFSPSVVEIDTVRYDGGTLQADFVFENIADKDVTILDVRSQCGCVVPSFSRKALRPGEKGIVSVTFDPSATWGEQKRYLTVIATNGDYRKLNTLQLHGYVQRDLSEAQIRFPVDLGGGIRTELETVGLRLRKAGETVERSIVLYNDGSVPVRLSWKGSRRVKGKLGQRSLAPGERTRLDIRYSTKGLPSGEFDDRIVVSADGKALSPIRLTGTIE